MLKTKIAQQQINAVFFLDQLYFSIKKAIILSKTAVTVEKLAKIMNRKNNAPQTLPSGIFTKTFGSVMKISGGPASGRVPNAKQAGKIINPETMATNVSSTQMREDSLRRVLSFDI